MILIFNSMRKCSRLNRVFVYQVNLREKVAKVCLYYSPVYHVFQMPNRRSISSNSPSFCYCCSQRFSLCLTLVSSMGKLVLASFFEQLSAGQSRLNGGSLINSSKQRVWNQWPQNALSGIIPLSSTPARKFVINGFLQTSQTADGRKRTKLSAKYLMA